MNIENNAQRLFVAATLTALTGETLPDARPPAPFVPSVAAREGAGQQQEPVNPHAFQRNLSRRQRKAATARAK